MSWYQTVITIGAKKRGCHLITKEILSHVPKIKDYKVGLANLFSMSKLFFFVYP